MPEKLEKTDELTSILRNFFRKKYYKNLTKAAIENEPIVIDFDLLDKFSPELGELLINKPEDFFEIANEAIKQIDLPGNVKIKVENLTESLSVRDLRAKHIDKFICTEGVVRKASEIRPEITETIWDCDCGAKIREKTRMGFKMKPSKCDECGAIRGFKQTGKVMIDTRWIVIEEPFELTEGDRPSQVTVVLRDELVSPKNRKLTDPGNRIKITGILKDIPKVKLSSAKLDFYLSTNHVEPTEIGWEKLEISKEDEEEIKNLAKDPDIYNKLINSLAPSLYGLKDVKESIVLQLFGGVHKILKDKMKFRGDIHILLLGDPSSGKSQLLKLVPRIVPRGKYVSGKGTTTAGLTATVSKDEQFMGGWVLEAGALVLANKGVLAVDEFEKMATEDQVAMHEGMEQGSISIAKASIIATLPAETSILAGGNPKYSRFDPYLPISKQITIPDTLLGRFDLKFMLRDLPNMEEDEKIAAHVLLSRDTDSDISTPVLDPIFIKKYIGYAKQNCIPVQTKETGKILKKFYIESRGRALRKGAPIPITLRQFEALLRLAEASAKIQLSPVVRKKDAMRAIRLMKVSLNQLGYDYESGAIDVDRSEGITTSSERSHIRTVLDIIDMLFTKKDEVAAGEIEEAAKKEGVPNPGEIIERLKREGVLFEPSPGYLKKVM